MSEDSGAPLDLSCVIITLNEERRLPTCLGSLPRGAEVVVLDSGSTDRTVELAERAGAKVSRRSFDDHASQKNAAMALATRRWVLSLDADEVLDDRLRQSIETVCRLPEAPYPGYRLTRRLWFMGRRMRFGKTVDHPVRLVLRGKGRFTQAIHERLELDGDLRLGWLAGEAAHHSYDDVSDYFRRFDSYTTKIADNHARRGRKMPWGPLHWLRPWSEFLSRYVFRCGFLDGYPGYCYALFSSLYTFVKYVKLRERLRS